jgi:hypothetical protein
MPERIKFRVQRSKSKLHENDSNRTNLRERSKKWMKVKSKSSVAAWNFQVILPRELATIRFSFDSGSHGGAALVDEISPPEIQF